MGSSNTIQAQARLNQEFQQYLDQQTNALDTMMATAQTTLDQQIAAYYQQGNRGDEKPMCSGAYQHLTTASEWSLNSVSMIIDALRDSLFAKASPPDGSVVSPDTSILAHDFAQQSETGLLIATAAFTAIQGTLVAFTSQPQTRLQQQFVTQELVPGLTLFLCVIENQFQAAGFFSDETIIQNGYIFDARFSVNQAGDVAEFNQVQALIAEQSVIEDYIAQCNAGLGKLAVTDPDFDVKSTKFTRLQDGFINMLDSLQGRINVLGTQQPLQPVPAGAPANNPA